MESAVPSSETSLTSLREFLNRVPKSELHIHLRGAMPAALFAELVRKHPPREALRGAPPRHIDLFAQCKNLRPFLSGAPPSPEAVEDLFRAGSFSEFLATYLFTSYFVREIDDFRSLVQSVKETLAGQNVVYAEVTVSIVEYVNQGVPLPAMLAVLEEEGRTPRICLQWIVDLVRDVGPEAGLSLLRRILADRPSSLVGITLGGSEHRFPAAPFRDAYRLAREHGLGLTIHAGEALGPESVWEAVRELKVDRIGHGVRAVEDPQLVEYLATRKIPLEICPTSNLRTGIYPSYEEHPVRALYEAGIPVTINTDDPSFFGVTLTEEHLRLLDLGFSARETLSLIKNGFRYAFLAPEEIDSYLKAVDGHCKDLPLA